MLPSRFETSQLHSSYHVTIPCFYHCISDVLSFSFSDLRRVQVQKMEKVNIVSKFLLSYRCSVWIYFLILSSIIDSDKDEGTYCPPVKRERTSSFPPPHSGKLQEAENFEFVFYSMLWFVCWISVHLLLSSSQEQCVHALKFLPVSNRELWLWAGWGPFWSLTLQDSFCCFQVRK